MGQRPVLTKQVVYSCGCGFITETELKATTHANTRGHSVTVNGTIRAIENSRKFRRDFTAVEMEREKQ